MAKLRLEQAIREEASDLHILPGLPPYLRIEGKLKPVSDRVVSDEQHHGLAEELGLSQKQQEQFEQVRGLDFAYALPNGERFRGNTVVSQGVPAYTFRQVPSSIPRFEELGFLHYLSHLRKRKIYIKDFITPSV